MSVIATEGGVEPPVTTTDQHDEIIHQCARCYGRFPGTGVVNQNKLYCCDKCANGSLMALRMLSAVVIISGISLVAGAYLSRRWSAHQPRADES